jgi:hypothetical protein
MHRILSQTNAPYTVTDYTNSHHLVSSHNAPYTVTDYTICICYFSAKHEALMRKRRLVGSESG